MGLVSRRRSGNRRRWYWSAEGATAEDSEDGQYETQLGEGIPGAPENATEAGWIRYLVSRRRSGNRRRWYWSAEDTTAEDSEDHQGWRNEAQLGEGIPGAPENATAQKEYLISRRRHDHRRRWYGATAYSPDAGSSPQTHKSEVNSSATDLGAGLFANTTLKDSDVRHAVK